MMETLKDNIPTWVSIELVLLFIVVVLCWLMWSDAADDEKEADERDKAYNKMLKNQEMLKNKLEKVESGIASVRLLLEIHAPTSEEEVVIVKTNGTKIVEVSDPDDIYNRLGSLNKGHGGFQQ